MKNKINARTICKNCKLILIATFLLSLIFQENKTFATAPAQLLYAISGAGPKTPSVLYTLNPSTGAITSTIGLSGYYSVAGLAVHPITGTIYGMAQDSMSGQFVGKLITINPFTGEGTLIGTNEIRVPDMSFSPSGELYAFGNSKELYTINITTGSATLVGFVKKASAVGLAFNKNGQLYMKDDRWLYRINKTTGAIIDSVRYSVSGGDADNLLAFDKDDILYTGLHVHDDTSFFSLRKLNPTTGVLTRIGSNGNGLISAIDFGFGCPSPIITSSGSGINSSLDAGVHSSYLWSTGETTQTINVSVSGTYSITVTDGECVKTASKEVIISLCSTVFSSFSAAACNNYTLPWVDIVYSSGNYSHTYQTVNNCDSVVTVSVTINNSTSSSFTATGCSSYTLPWGDVVTASGNYSHTYQTVNNCDSVVTVSVTINNSTSSSFTATGCSSYTLPWGDVVTASGNYSHTYQTVNNCDSVVTATVTIGFMPSVTIVLIGSDFCSNTILGANVSPAGSYNYSWSNGSNSSKINLTVSSSDGIYSVNVSNGSGCSGSASYNYLKQNLYNSYTILGLKDVKLGENNTVNGAVGNSGGGMKVDINKNSIVNGFVKSSVISLRQPVTVSGSLFYDSVKVVIPPVVVNLANTSSMQKLTLPDDYIGIVNGNYGNLTIGRRAIVTVTGSIFGTILIKEAADVIFTQNDFSVDQLTTENGKGISPGIYDYTTIAFQPNTNIRIKNKLAIGEKNKFNVGNSFGVTAYLCDLTTDAEKIAINGKNTTINTNLYMPYGGMTIKGPDANNPCTINGKVICQLIAGENYVTWNGVNCISNKTSAEIKPETKAEENSLNVLVYPNPSASNFFIQIQSGNDELVNIRIINIIGQVVINMNEVSKEKLITVGDNLKAGNYFAEIKQGTNRKVIKLVKIN